MKKYEIVQAMQELHSMNHKIFRIRALRDFSDVKAGDLGGFVESEMNLSHSGNCWVYNDAVVAGEGRVREDAIVKDTAAVEGSAYYSAVIQDRAFVGVGTSVCGTVKDNAFLYGFAFVATHAEVGGNNTRLSHSANIGIGGRIKSSNDYIVFSNVGSSNAVLTAYRTDSGIGCHRGCFDGTLEEFADKVNIVYGSSKIGRQYKSIIETIKIHFEVK